MRLLCDSARCKRLENTREACKTQDVAECFKLSSSFTVRTIIPNNFSKNIKDIKF